MVKIKIYLMFFILFSFSANSCFLVYENLVYDSDIDERRAVKDKILVDEIHDILQNIGSPFNIVSGSYSFVVLTDTHIDGDTEELENGLINLITTNTDIKFAVVLGDLTASGESKNYNRFIEVAKKIANEAKIPLYPVLGNHDLIGNGWDNWKTKIGATNYRIDNNNTTLIMLDAANMYFGKKQLDWLEKEIKTANRDLFIFAHLPIFSKGFWTQSDLNERARIVSMLQNKCDAMFGGHTHVRHMQRTGNVDYINIESFRDDKTYCLITVTDGVVSYTWGKF